MSFKVLYAVKGDPYMNKKEYQTFRPALAFYDKVRKRSTVTGAVLLVSGTKIEKTGTINYGRV